MAKLRPGVARLDASYFFSIGQSYTLQW